MIILRFPHAKVAAKKAEISMSSFCEKRCGTWIGSDSIKSAQLYKITFSSKKDFNSSVFILNFKSSVGHDQFSVCHIGEFLVVRNDDESLSEFVSQPEKSLMQLFSIFRSQIS